MSYLYPENTDLKSGDIDKKQNTNSQYQKSDSQNFSIRKEYDKDFINELLFEERQKSIYNYPLSCPEKCAYCGCEILENNIYAKVNCTGDIIHEECWQNYAEEYFEELCSVLSSVSDNAPEGFFKEEWE